MRHHLKSSACLTTFCLCSILIVLAQDSHSLPPGFVYLDDLAPGVVFDLRYAGHNNFIGQAIEGYEKSRCILTEESTQALKLVQSDLNRVGLGLKIFDAYRSQRAVNSFVRWASDINDLRMKSQYYPDLDKESLFPAGYIAGRSSHSRGSTVDITIVSLHPSDNFAELDMGTPFDYFDPKSWISNVELSPNQRANRLLLRTIMERRGFQPYDKEWWHFTLIKEPFPDTYFDFPVE